MNLALRPWKWRTLRKPQPTWVSLELDGVRYTLSMSVDHDGVWVRVEGRISVLAYWDPMGGLRGSEHELAGRDVGAIAGACARIWAADPEGVSRAPKA